jgi:hypothetical protein
MAAIVQSIELNPPRTWAVRGVGGRLTAVAKGTI